MESKKIFELTSDRAICPATMPPPSPETAGVTDPGNSLVGIDPVEEKGSATRDRSGHRDPQIRNVHCRLPLYSSQLN